MATLLSNLCMFIYVSCALVACGSMKMSFTCLSTTRLLIKYSVYVCVFKHVNTQCCIKIDLVT